MGITISSPQLAHTYLASLLMVTILSGRWRMRDTGFQKACFFNQSREGSLPTQVDLDVNYIRPTAEI